MRKVAIEPFRRGISIYFMRKLLVKTAFTSLLVSILGGTAFATDVADTVVKPARPGAGIKIARSRARVDGPPEAYRELIAKHASINEVPADLVHRVIMRESRYNQHLVFNGNYGIMQIRLGTARALGYKGSVEGLLDADTNMMYAVRYLAGAFKISGGNYDRTIAFYTRGYYHEAKRRGMRSKP